MLARSQTPTARGEYRKYLELAPLGTHAAAAASALELCRRDGDAPPARRLSLADLRARYVDGGRPLPAALEAALAPTARRRGRDPGRVARRRRDNRAEGQRLRTMLRYETALWSTGVARVAGVDEAGMSPLAGPVAAAAVIFAPRNPHPGGRRFQAPRRRATRAAGADHSGARPRVGRRLRRGRRDRLAQHLLGRAGGDAPGGGGAGAGRGAPAHRRPARCATLPLPQQRIVKGDAKSLSIAAASILAKTARDARMRALDAQYPGYGFAQHKGYPVTRALPRPRRLGACPSTGVRSRACARRWGCRRCHRGRCGRGSTRRSSPPSKPAPTSPISRSAPQARCATIVFSGSRTLALRASAASVAV